MTLKKFHIITLISLAFLAAAPSVWAGLPDQISFDEIDKVTGEITAAFAEELSHVLLHPRINPVVNQHEDQDPLRLDLFSDGTLAIGGFRTYKLLNRDALLLMMCHELGHLLGGKPKMPSISQSWSTAEGQSDFFAVAECMPRFLMASQDPAPETPKMFRPLEPAVKSSCAQAWSSDESREICVRTEMAAIALSEFVWRAKPLYDARDKRTALRNGKTYTDPAPEQRPSYGSHDSSIAATTLLEEHPAVQCRLDTFVAGAELGEKPTPGEHRPACWYHP